MLRFFFVVLLPFCYLLLAANPTEEFYIFPLGQGNGQLVIYQRPEGSKVGILYDLGSKSLQMHPKFGMRGEWQRPFLAPIKKTLVMAASNEEDDILFTTQLSPSRSKVASSIQTPQTTEKKLHSKQRNTIKNELEELIHGQLDSLEHLFIFLSHSDEDHINFLNKENIPAHVPITVILAGDWFGDIGAVDGKTNFTEPAKKVLVFLSERIASRIPTQFYFPYYAPALNDHISAILQPHILLEAISDKKMPDALKIIDDIAQPIIQQCLKINPAAPTPPFLHGPFLEVFRHLPIDQKFHDILNNVYIWNLNQPADDTNNHSMVVSCTLPTLNMSVILTGDAENSVLHRIVAENAGFDFRSKLGLSNPSHTVLLMLPHHGAWANRSGSALRFFTPNVFGISAGDGRQHGHPSAELIAMIRNIYERYPFSHFLGQFYEQHKYERKFHFISLNSEKEHMIDKAAEGKLLFLCPNIYGCIKWDQEGIRTNFNNLIKLSDGEKYSVLYAAHTFETDVNNLGSGEIGTHILGRSPNTTSTEEALTLIEKPENFPYEYLAINASGELFVGINIVDAEEKKVTKSNRIYFYKLLAAE